MTDPIADMLTRIRNANKEKFEKVEMPSSNMKVAIAKVLFEEGYIKSYQIEETGVQPTLVIELKYDEKGNRVLVGLKRISKPGLRTFAKLEELPKVLNGLGIALISTSKGLVTDKKARELGVGGEVIAYIW